MPRARACIADVNAYFPGQKIDNAMLLERMTAPFPLPGPQTLHRLCGLESRYFAARDEQVSDLAVSAARPLLEGCQASSIDLLLFASACSDLIEPATANIVQHKLGLRCPVMDIKNACNSFVSAMHVAAAFIECGTYRRILIVNGEKLSDAIRLRYETPGQLIEGAAAFTFCDAGAAMLMEAGTDPNRGLFFERFLSLGHHWTLCTVPGGGSMFPHDSDASYFRGRTGELREVITDEATLLWRECQPQIAWKPEDVDWVFTHQVSEGAFRAVLDLIGVGPERSVNLFPTHGNMAASSIPACMAAVNGRLRRGDKIVLVGLAAGISISFQAAIW